MADWYTAMSWLARGKRIQREAWPEDCIIRHIMTGQPIRMYTAFGTRPWTPTVEDFKADDWKEVIINDRP